MYYLSSYVTIASLGVDNNTGDNTHAGASSGAGDATCADFPASANVVDGNGNDDDDNR